MNERISESHSVSELEITVDDILSEIELKAFCDNCNFDGSDSDDDTHFNNIAERSNDANETEGDQKLKFRSQLEEWASDDMCFVSQ